MGRKVTDDEVEEWLVLKKRGYTNKAIGEKFGRDEKTIGRGLKEYLGRRGQGSPQDPELDILKREMEKHQVLIELDRLREEREGLPKRLEGFAVDLSDLKTTLKAFGEDLECLRVRFNSLPIADLGKWRCSGCGEPYVVVKIMCSSCGRESWYASSPGEKD